MRLHALLSWYDEPENLLVLCLDGLARAGVTNVIAVDGRYELFPADTDVSDGRQRAVIAAACRHHRMSSVILSPNSAWENESAKRNALFSLALGVSTRDDWWWVIDTDEIVMEVPEDFHLRLAAAEEDSAQCLLIDTMAREVKRPDWPVDSWLRCLFRAQPIRVDKRHCDYFNTQTGKQLWGGADPTGLDPPLDFGRELVIEHRPRRDPGRQFMKDQYYVRRNELGVEMGRCRRCESPATKRVYTSFTMVNGLPQGLIEEVCGPCATRLETAAHKWLRRRGFDPKKLRFNERYAPAGA